MLIFQKITKHISSVFYAFFSCSGSRKIAAYSSTLTVWIVFHIRLWNKMRAVLSGNGPKLPIKWVCCMVLLLHRHSQQFSQYLWGWGISLCLIDWITFWKTKTVGMGYLWSSLFNVMNYIYIGQILKYSFQQKFDLNNS